MKRVAVFGAAGFVGATFVERLLERGWDVRPCIHSAGNAWRLARHGLSLRSVDVRDPEAVRDALDGCSYVVNGVLGPKDVMTKGLDVQLAESRRAGIERFVHLSSVSVYGDRTPGTVLASDDAASQTLTDYGELKRAQDKRVAAAALGGLSVVTVAPPNISGAHSPFLLRIVRAILDGRLALIDGGDLPCSLVDVENLAAALEGALEAPRASASPVLVTDDDDVTWRELVDALTPLTGVRSDQIPSLTRDETHRLAPAAPSGSLFRTAKRLAGVAVGAEARAVLKSDPRAQRAYGWLIESLPGGAGPRLRKRLSRGQAATASGSPPERYDPQLLAVQLRAVRHDARAARERIGYTPVLSASQSATAFVRYYRALHGDDPDEAALRHPRGTSSA